MVVNGGIKIEMSHSEHSDLVFCLKCYAEDCHLRLLLAQNRNADEKTLNLYQKQLNRAIDAFEGVSCSEYNIPEMEGIMLSRVQSKFSF